MSSQSLMGRFRAGLIPHSARQTKFPELPGDIAKAAHRAERKADLALAVLGAFQLAIFLFREKAGAMDYVLATMTLLAAISPLFIFGYHRIRWGILFCLYGEGMGVSSDDVDRFLTGVALRHQITPHGTAVAMAGNMDVRRPPLFKISVEWRDEEGRLQSEEATEEENFAFLRMLSPDGNPYRSGRFALRREINTTDMTSHQKIESMLLVSRHIQEIDKN